MAISFVSSCSSDSLINAKVLTAVHAEIVEGTPEANRYIELSKLFKKVVAYRLSRGDNQW